MVKVRSPLAALRRYYPGFFGALFLVLLRLAIGWHFLYEGTQKILSTPEGKASVLARVFPASESPSFSSEGYLRGATGPLAPRFRSLVPDVDSRGKLDLDSLQSFWTSEVERMSAHFHLDENPPAEPSKDGGAKPTPEPPKDDKPAVTEPAKDEKPVNPKSPKDEKPGDPKSPKDDKPAIPEPPKDDKPAPPVEKPAARATAELAKTKQAAVDWFQTVDNREKIKKYLDKLADIEAIESNSKALDYERENARRDRKTAEADRKELVAVVDGWTNGLRDAITAIAGPDRLAKYGPYAPEPSPLVEMDRFTMYSLAAIGLCLMLGLFTPLASLGGATFLLSIYLSSPPWPGVPEVGPGHYRFVNYPLIEMLACLALASTPSGLWIGLDAILFGWIGRGRRRREVAEAFALAQAHAEGQGRNDRPAPQDRRKFKSR